MATLLPPMHPFKIQPHMSHCDLCLREEAQIYLELSKLFLLCTHSCKAEKKKTQEILKIHC